MGKYWRLLAISLLTASLSSFAQISSTPIAKAHPALPSKLPHQDTVIIAEAYHLWQSLGEKLWPGWTEVSMPVLYVTSDYEYAVGFPRALAGFSPLEQNDGLGKSIQVRRRSFAPDFSASFSVQGIPAVVIGTPTALEKSSGMWVLTTIHEMFHVLQTLRGSGKKVAQLKLGSETDASWQLNFPFPYKDADVIRLIHLQSYPVYLAATDTDEAGIKYNAGTAVEGIRVYQRLLQLQSPDQQFYKYSQFQEWTEGIAFYTEYKMAEAAASDSYKPTVAFRQLPDYKSYLQLWDEGYKNRIFLVKQAGRAAQSRTAFYHLGLGKGLLLDRLMPDWKTRYFAPSNWLNDLLMTALGQPSELPTLTAGAAVPDFNLTATTGESLSLNRYRGKVLLIDFWQTWCPPCVEAVPHLKSLQEKYKNQGLVVLGVTDKLDQEGIGKLREFVRDYRINYPILMDEKGTVAAQYNVSGYPHTFIIDRNGRLAYDKHGYKRGDETELEKEILKVLPNQK